MTRILEWKGHVWLGLATRLYLGVLFVTASWHKILHPEAFAVDIATYQLLPLWAINGFALTLPWLELVTGVMLIAGLRVQAAAALIMGMMVSFLIALGWALHLHLDMSCGCFASQGTANDDPISWRTVVRDSIWLLQAAYVFVFDRAPLGIERAVLAYRRAKRRTRLLDKQ